MDADRLLVLLEEWWPGCWLRVHSDAGPKVAEWPEERVMVVLGDDRIEPWPGYSLVRLPSGKSSVWYRARLMDAMRRLNS